MPAGGQHDDGSIISSFSCLCCLLGVTICFKFFSYFCFSSHALFHFAVNGAHQQALPLIQHSQSAEKPWTQPACADGVGHSIRTRATDVDRWPTISLVSALTSYRVCCSFWLENGKMTEFASCFCPFQCFQSVNNVVIILPYSK